MIKTKKRIKEKTTKFSQYFFTLLRESKLFLLFSFFSCLLPIFYCLFAAMIKPDGSQAVMAIGYMAPFLLAFIQISFSISMIIFARLNRLKENIFKWKNDHTIMSSAIWMSLFIGAIMVIFYVLSSYFYIQYSTNKPNTQATLRYSLDFLATSIPIVLFFPLYTTSTFFIYNKNKIRSILSLILTFVLITIFSLVFCGYTSMKINGLSLGTMLGLLIGLLYNYLTIKFINPVMIYYPMQVSHFNVLISRVVLRESFTSISLSLFKGIAIVAISFAIPLTINGFVPLGYQMSRVLWFNMMYFIPFLGIGFGETVRAHYLNYSDHEHDCYLSHTWKSDFKVIAITFFITILLCIGGVFLVKPLTQFYTRNDYNPFANGAMPEIVGWGTPTSISIDTLPNVNVLSQLKWVPLPNFTGNAIMDRIKFLKWISDIKKENVEIWPLAKLEIAKLGEWIKWFSQKNANGISIISFFKNNNDAKGAVSYLVYLWLYTSTDPIVTQSFISLRPLIDYHNSMFASNTDLFTSLFLISNSFDAKSMIYICIFSLLNSIWAILLQTNQRNLRRGMPWWLMMIIYAVCIGGLVTFGVLFGVTLKDTLGNSNPFQYLDAWTFPLIIISICAISVVSAISYKSWKFLETQKQLKGRK